MESAVPENSATDTVSPETSAPGPGQSRPPGGAPIATSKAGLSAIADAVAESMNGEQREAQDTDPEDGPQGEGEPEPNQKFKWKTRAGEEREATLAELKRNFGLVAESHKRMKEAAEVRKGIEAERAQMAKEREQTKLLREQASQASQLLENLSDLDTYLEFGKQYYKHDLEAAVEQRLIRRVKREMASQNPNDPANQALLRALDLEDENENIQRENRRFKRDQERQTKHQERQRHEQETQGHFDRIQADIEKYAQENGKPDNDKHIAALTLMDKLSGTDSALSYPEAMEIIVNRAGRNQGSRTLQAVNQSAQMSPKPDHPPAASQAAPQRSSQAPFRPHQTNPAPKPTENQPQGLESYFDQFDDRKARRNAQLEKIWGKR